MATNASKQIGLVVVNRYRIIGTSLVVFEAWEPCDGHSTITHVGSVRMGRVGTGPLPPSIDKLPAMSDERYTAVKAYQAAQYRRAYALIVEAFPEASEGRPDMGSIEIVEGK